VTFGFPFPSVGKRKITQKVSEKIEWSARDEKGKRDRELWNGKEDGKGLWAIATNTATFPCIQKKGVDKSELKTTTDERGSVLVNSKE